MGTNYYLIKNPCSYCGRAEGREHIGKSSAGWCFSLHVTEEIRGLEDWKRHFNENRIEDEYGQIVSTQRMLEIITERSWASRNRCFLLLLTN